MLSVFRFEHPEWLWALWVAPILAGLFYWSNKRRRRLLNNWAHHRVLPALLPGYLPGRVVVKQILLLLSYISFVLALANPQIGSRLEEVKRSGVDVMVALDVSLSMQAEDIKPNRLEKAKHEIKRLIDILQGDRIGLIPFAGVAYVLCPLTLDYSAAKMFLHMMTTDLIPVPGTAIGQAIEMAIRSFNQKEKKYKVLILITDGEDHQTKPIEWAKKAAEQGVIIYTIGLGSPQGVPIPLYDKYGNPIGFKKDRQGNVVTTRLDVETLRAVAQITGGKFYPSTGGESELKEIYREIKKMEKKELAVRKFSQYEDRYQIFALLAWLFLTWELLLATRVSRSGQVLGA